MADFKAARLSSDIQRIVGGKLRDLKDPRIDSERLTVVRAEVSRDRSVAKIYVSSLDGMAGAKEAVKGLESASGAAPTSASSTCPKHWPPGRSSSGTAK